MKAKNIRTSKFTGLVLNYFRALTDLILPRKCVVCGRNLNLDEEHICIICLAELPLTYYWKMPHNPMSDRFNELMQECIQKYEGYTLACALFYYSSENNFRHITHSVKYNGNIREGTYFGKILGDFLSKSELFESIDLIVPVPLHWTRQFKRGYNQAEVIAKGICSKTAAPVEPKLLIRKKKTKSQTVLNIQEKKDNVKDAFKVNINKFDMHRTAGHILLVDDVFTTGATLQSCHYALRKIYGTKVRISIATLGFVHS